MSSINFNGKRSRSDECTEFDVVWQPESQSPKKLRDDFEFVSEIQTIEQSKIPKPFAFRLSPTSKHSRSFSATRTIPTLSLPALSPCSDSYCSSDDEFDSDDISISDSISLSDSIRETTIYIADPYATHDYNNDMDLDEDNHMEVLDTVFSPMRDSFDDFTTFKRPSYLTHFRSTFKTEIERIPTPIYNSYTQSSPSRNTTMRKELPRLSIPAPKSLALPGLIEEEEEHIECKAPTSTPVYEAILCKTPQIVQTDFQIETSPAPVKSKFSERIGLFSRRRGLSFDGKSSFPSLISGCGMSMSTKRASCDIRLGITLL